MRRNVACRSIASGVVRSTSSSAPPTTCFTVPSKPGRHPRRLEDLADQEGRGRLAVGPGHPHHLQLRRSDLPRSAPPKAPWPPARPRPRPGQRGRSSSRSTTSADGPGLDCLRGELVPVRLLPGHAEEQRLRARLFGCHRPDRQARRRTISRSWLGSLRPQSRSRSRHALDSRCEAGHPLRERPAHRALLRAEPRGRAARRPRSSRTPERPPTRRSISPPEG